MNWEGGTIHWTDVEEQTSVPSRSGELLMKLPFSANVTLDMKLCESGGALAVDMGVPVSKMEESIVAHYRTSFKTAQDPDGGPFPAYPSGKSWDNTSGKTGLGKKFYHSVYSGADFAVQPCYVAIVETLSEQQLVDCITVDSACNDELTNNSFAFDKKRMPRARRPVTVTLSRNQGQLQGFELQR